MTLLQGPTTKLSLCFRLAQASMAALIVLVLEGADLSSRSCAALIRRAKQFALLMTFTPARAIGDESPKKAIRFVR